jgi:hypothetical protein
MWVASVVVAALHRMPSEELRGPIQLGSEKKDA